MTPVWDTTGIPHKNVFEGSQCLETFLHTLNRPVTLFKFSLTFIQNITEFSVTLKNFFPSHFLTYGNPARLFTFAFLKSPHVDLESKEMQTAYCKSSQKILNVCNRDERSGDLKQINGGEIWSPRNLTIFNTLYFHGSF